MTGRGRQATVAPTRCLPCASREGKRGCRGAHREVCEKTMAKIRDCVHKLGLTKAASKPQEAGDAGQAPPFRPLRGPIYPHSDFTLQTHGKVPVAESTFYGTLSQQLQETNTSRLHL